MLHLTPDKNRMYSEKSAWSEHTAECKIDNRSFYDILDQIFKDRDLYPYFKQHKSKRDRGGFYAIHFRWLGPNHANTASEATIVLQMLKYGEEKAFNWEKYVVQHVKYHIILENLMELGYQGFDTGSKVQYLLNGIRCDICPQQLP